MSETYQTVLLIPESVLNDLQQRITTLESKDKCNTLLDSNNTLLSEDRIIPYNEAALALGIDKQSLIRARNTGRIRGVKIDGRGYGYRESEIQRYKKDKGRNKESE